MGSKTQPRPKLTLGVETAIRLSFRTSVLCAVRNLGEPREVSRSLRHNNRALGSFPYCSEQVRRYKTIHHPCQSPVAISTMMATEFRPVAQLSRNWPLITGHGPLSFKSQTSKCSSPPDFARGKTRPRPTPSLQPVCGETASSTCVVMDSRPAGTECAVRR
jgi:hypothetical protein